MPGGAARASNAGGVTTEVDSISDTWSWGTEAQRSEPYDIADVEELVRSLGMTPCLAGEPVLPPPEGIAQVCVGTQPPPYHNLFWRQYITSQRQPGGLTAEFLAQQGAELELWASSEGDEALPGTDGEWPERLDAGDDLGNHVISARFAPTLGSLGQGRPGFVTIEEESSAPGHTLPHSTGSSIDDPEMDIETLRNLVGLPEGGLEML